LKVTLWSNLVEWRTVYVSASSSIGRIAFTPSAYPPLMIGLSNRARAHGGFSMNGKRMFRVIAVAGLAKLVIRRHRHRMSTGAGQRGNWHDRIAELHRELHRNDAEANAQPAAAPTD
jgi:hypothetical protein